jgi:hypothetical protein
VSLLLAHSPDVKLHQGDLLLLLAELRHEPVVELIFVCLVQGKAVVELVVG